MLKIIKTKGIGRVIEEIPISHDKTFKRYEKYIAQISDGDENYDVMALERANLVDLYKHGLRNKMKRSEADFVFSCWSNLPALA